jgi:hypothetical protein
VKYIDEKTVIAEAARHYADYLHKQEQFMGVDAVDVPRSTRAAIKAIVRAINKVLNDQS